MAEKLSELFEDQAQPAAAAPIAPEPTGQAPAAPAVVPTPEAPKAPDAPRPEPGFVPIAAVLDEREKRQKLEKDFADFRARYPEQAPSVPADPNELAAYINDQNQRALTSGRFDVSEALATQTHGEPVVKAAMDWGMQRAQESPAFAAEYMRQKHPIDWAVRQHKREQLISEMGDDEAKQRAFIERRARELGILPASPTAPQGASAPAAPQPVAQPRPAAPSPSLASAPSAGSPMTNVAPANQVVERLFGKT